MADPDEPTPEPNPVPPESAAETNGTDADDPWVDMKLARVIVRDQSEQQWIYLSEIDGTRGFPIVIGSPEAHEIQRVVTGTSLERPLTHQMAFASIEALDAELTRVDITDLRNNTFFARLILIDGQGEEKHIDARPSDAVCLGLRAGCGIRVAESVLEQVRTDESGPDTLPTGMPDKPLPPDAPEDQAGEEDPESDSDESNPT
jgi:uncharacterized protein